jgi:hypothetical protein
MTMTRVCATRAAAATHPSPRCPGLTKRSRRLALKTFDVGRKRDLALKFDREKPVVSSRKDMHGEGGPAPEGAGLAENDICFLAWLFRASAQHILRPAVSPGLGIMALTNTIICNGARAPTTTGAVKPASD